MSLNLEEREHREGLDKKKKRPEKFPFRIACTDIWSVLLDSSCERSTNPNLYIFHIIFAKKENGFFNCFAHFHIRTRRSGILYILQPLSALFHGANHFIAESNQVFQVSFAAGKSELTFADCPVLVCLGEASRNAYSLYRTAVRLCPVTPTSPPNCPPPLPCISVILSAASLRMPVGTDEYVEVRVVRRKKLCSEAERFFLLFCNECQQQC